MSTKTSSSTPTNSPTSAISYDQLFCPSLQDTCKLYLLATIDEYPIYALAKLPLLMRRKLFMAMPVTDRVHFEGTVFLDGLEVVEHEEYIPGSNTTVFLSSIVYGSDAVGYTVPKSDSASIKASLVSALFGQVEHDRLANYCTLNLQDALGSFDCLDTSLDNILTATDLIKCLVHQIVHSLHINNRLNTLHRSKGYCSMSYLEYSNDGEYVHDAAIVIPSRPFICGPPQATYQYKSTERVWFYQPLQLQDYQHFAEYCNLAPSIPAHLEINQIDFFYSPIWKDYELTRNNAMEKARVLGLRDISAVDPFVSNPSYPYLHELLHSVEHLTLQNTTPFSYRFNSEFEECRLDSCIVIPYLLMSAITANKSTTACLKSISIYGVMLAEGAVLSLSAIAGFLIGSGYFASSSSYYVECGETDRFHYTLSPPEGDPYLIESLTFNIRGYLLEMTIATDSRLVSKIIKALLNKQMDNLKSVIVSGIRVSPKEMLGSPEECGFDAYQSPPHDKTQSKMPAKKYTSLMSALVNFVKQPQFCSLTLIELPESCCYHLVHAFLTVPTSHDQTLSLSVKKADSAAKCIIDLSSSPGRRTTLKSLNFNNRSDNCKLCREVISLPGLCLKSIELQAEALISISEEVKVDIPHVCINFCNLSKIPRNYEAELCRSACRFLCGNVSLTILEFGPNENMQTTFSPIFNSILNSLLSKQERLQKTLEEIRIQRADNFEYSGSNPDLTMDDWDLEPPNSNTSVDGDFQSATAGGSDLVDFFVLVQKFGEVSLRLPGDLFNNLPLIEELLLMIPDLRKRFKRKKIPKISINQQEHSYGFEDLLQILESITDKVVID